MTGLVIFLGILLALFVVAAIVLLVLIISLSRKISRTQQNVQIARKSVGELTDLISVGSSIAALAGSAAGIAKKFRARKTAKTRKASDERTGKVR